MTSQQDFIVRTGSLSFTCHCFQKFHIPFFLVVSFYPNTCFFFCGMGETYGTVHRITL